MGRIQITTLTTLFSAFLALRSSVSAAQNPSNAARLSMVIDDAVCYAQECPLTPHWNPFYINKDDNVSTSNEASNDTVYVSRNHVFQRQPLSFVEDLHFSGINLFNALSLSIMSYKVPSSIYAVILWSSLVPLLHGQGSWTTGTEKIPYPLSNSFFGRKWKGTEQEAWIIGGQGQNGRHTSVISFNFKTKKFTKHSDLPHPVQSWGTEGTQYQSGEYNVNKLYFITPAPIMNNEHYISTYDLKSSQYTRNAVPYNPTDQSGQSMVTSQSPCVVNYGSLLLVLGGFADNPVGNCVDYFTIYKITTNAWQKHGPKLPLMMSHFTCDVNLNTLYVIGGAGSTTGCRTWGTDNVKVSGDIYYLTRLYRLGTQYESKWTSFSSLSTPRYMHSSVVVHGEDIYVIGGYVNLWDAQKGHEITKSVEIIHTKSSSENTPVSKSLFHDLEIGVGRASGAFYNELQLYIFGGVFSSQPEGVQMTDRYQYRTGPTSNPTKAPTTDPTLYGSGARISPPRIVPTESTTTTTAIPLFVFIALFIATVVISIYNCGLIFQITDIK